MFAPPPEVTAEVVTRLPDELRRAGQPADWAYERPIHSFLEGPVFDHEGNLYVVDIPHGRIFRISPAGEWHVLQRPSPRNAPHRPKIPSDCCCAAAGAAKRRKTQRKFRVRIDR